MRTGPEFSRPVMNSIGEYIMFCNLAHFELFAKTVEVGLKSTITVSIKKQIRYFASVPSVHNRIWLK